MSLKKELLSIVKQYVNDTNNIDDINITGNNITTINSNKLIATIKEYGGGYVDITFTKEFGGRSTTHRFQ
jgi:hypothetical protein